MCRDNALSHAGHPSDQTRPDALAKEGDRPTAFTPAQVRVLPHKAAVLQMGQPPSRSQVLIGGYLRQETARTYRRSRSKKRQDTSSLPNLNDFSNKCGNWPTASDLFRGATPNVHRDARVKPSKDHHIRRSRCVFAHCVCCSVSTWNHKPWLPHARDQLLRIVRVWLRIWEA